MLTIGEIMIGVLHACAWCVILIATCAASVAHSSYWLALFPVEMCGLLWTTQKLASWKVDRGMSETSHDIPPGTQ